MEQLGCFSGALLEVIRHAEVARVFSFIKEENTHIPAKLRVREYKEFVKRQQEQKNEGSYR